MLATPVKSPRHAAEAGLIEQAVAGSPAAVDSILSQLGSANPWLQQIMREALQDSDSLALWQRLLECLALRRWSDHPDSHRRLEREASQRIDEAIVRLFAEDETGAPSPPVKLAVLHAALASPDCRVRSAAGVALGMRGDTRGVEALIEAIRQGESECRLWAVKALGQLKDERGGWAVIEALACDDETLHWEASHALAQMNDKAVPALIDALKHPRPHVRWHAARALGSIADPRAALGLAEALADDDYSVRWAVADALPNLGAAAVPKILDRLARYVPVDDVYQAASHALRRIAMGSDLRVRLDPLLKALLAGTAPVEVPMLAYRLLQEWETNA